MTKTKQRAVGLKKSTHKYCIKEFIDYDYVKKLTYDEQVWLATFTDEFYGNGWKENNHIHSKEEQLTNYNRHNCAQRNITTYKGKIDNRKRKEPNRHYTKEDYIQIYLTASQLEDALIDLIEIQQDGYATEGENNV